MSLTTYRQRLPKTLGILLLLRIYTTSAFAQTDPKAINSFSIIVEQDSFLELVGIPLNEDRNYTQGLGINFTSGKLTENLDTYLETHPKLKKVIGMDDSILYEYNLPLQISIQIAGFTPDDLRATEPVIGDRPYSSLLFLNTRLTRVDQQNYRSRSWGLGIGVLGVPNVARDIQTAIHEAANENNTRPPYNPEGWDNQISHGGEPTLLFSYQTKKLHTTKALEQEAGNGGSSSRKIQAQFSTTFDLDVFYITQASFGADFRLGLLDLRNWYSNMGWGLDPLQKNATSGDPVQDQIKGDYFDQNRKLEFYFFASMKTGVLLYNSSLHGQFRETAYRLPYSETGFVLGTGRAGLAMGGDRIAVSAYTAFKTPEFWNEFSRLHYWIGVDFNLFF